MSEGEAEVIDKPVADTGTGTETTATAETATASAETATAETAAETGTETGDAGKKTEPDWPDDWRDRMAGGDEEALKYIKRFGSPKGVAKAFKEAQELIRSGKLKRDMPDAADEKAMAEWRKAEGIPDDPSGYVLPETVTKRMTDADKPMLANFAEYAHKKGRGQDFVAGAAEWYVDTVEAMEAARAATDDEQRDKAEDALRADWGREYKANMTLANRFMEGIPGVGKDWHLARMPDGRVLGADPVFVSWASDQGRDRFGDATFASGDSERKHTARKEEIEQIMKTNINEYHEKGLDKEYLEILEKEQKRASRK